MLYPLKFRPIFKERIWGGRELERLFKKPLPTSQPIGESWELVHRPDDVSVIANGRFAGKTLRWLLDLHADKILGTRTPSLRHSTTPSRQSATQVSGFSPPPSPRFPLLIKWLDARELLSVQVHPPPHAAAQLGGEPKTEMWWVADATDDAEIFMGLKRGVTREQFERALTAGKVADCLHRVRPKRGDVFFIPSGRVHALGAGLVVLEIQQNSDTTYRVFDWNRTDASGRPRELHVAQALASIDFSDFEPAPVGRFCESAESSVADSQSRAANGRPIITCPHFQVRYLSIAAPHTDRCDGNNFQILCQLSGSALVASRTAPPHESFQETLTSGEITLLPAVLGDFRIEPLAQPCELMQVTLPSWPEA
jgi:mannose-6-phosphate isomerase